MLLAMALGSPSLHAADDSLGENAALQYWQAIWMLPNPG